jgi:hypothetical protein
MAVHNLRWLKTYDMLPQQHIVVFEKPKKDAPGTKPGAP